MEIFVPDVFIFCRVLVVMRLTSAAALMVENLRRQVRERMGDVEIDMCNDS